ncbi:hypothetical protein [Bacillus sp. B15-48]|uniref:hypothetical protein n=1 Tax=Bacillus sp. B15-48 TaxID=1548601 RepID=UPI001940053D|nr:hypothetical protein [Bacillus sp. B15-48]MBM4762009.1 hypothetical protein [Bacillus sp. B15-48]
MGIHIEKIYYLQNPESGIEKIASETEVKYENVIKDVFGVAFIEDLSKMIRYNKKFQEYICKANNIKEQEITMEMVIRLATKKDLLPIRMNYINMINQQQSRKSPPPFSTTIQLHEGVFNWNEKECSYDLVT